MIRHGYLQANEPASNHLKYNTMLLEGHHQWSKQNVGRTFGLREYDKFIPLKDYLTMPIDIFEDILEGVVEGKAEAARLLKEAAERAARQSGGVSDPGKAAINNALKESKRHG